MESHDKDQWIDDAPPKMRSWVIWAILAWLVLAVTLGFLAVCMGCQATTRIDGAKASASSITHTTKIKVDAPAPPPTIRVKIGPLPEVPK